LTAFVGCGTITEMSLTLEQAQSLVASLPRQDRARLFVWMAADMADQLPGIEFDPRVCGGSARIAGTRIPVWSLESWKRLGASDDEILRNHPSLQASDLLNAWQYVARHPQEINREISENQAEHDADHDTGHDARNNSGG
jgi:uncharacterized protein (DUF433 family)